VIGPFEENTIVVGDCLKIMSQMPKGCVDLVVTSPPYNVGKDYGEAYNDRQPVDDYFAFLRETMKSLYRLSKDAARIVVEIGGAGRNFPLSWVIQDGGFDAGFLLRGELVIPHRPTNRTAWGSYLSPSNPYTIPNFHMVYMFSKTTHGRADLRGATIPIEPSEWYEWTLGRWKVPYGRYDGHKATFSEDFARRCILLLSGQGDLIFDPFMGSGTTAVVADRLGRKFFGCDINPDYVEMALKRLEKDRAGRQLELL